LAGLMVSKYGSPEPVERVPLFGFYHLPLMKSSYCGEILMWSLDSGAGRACLPTGRLPVDLLGLGGHATKIAVTLL